MLIEAQGVGEGKKSFDLKFALKKRSLNAWFTGKRWSRLCLWIYGSGRDRKCRAMASGSFLSHFDLNDALHLGSFIVRPVTCRVSGTGNGVVVSKHQHLFCHLFIEIIMFHFLIPSVPMLTS